MNFLEPQRLETAFIAPGTPMLDDIVATIEADPHLRPSRRRDMISGLRRVAHALGRAPGEVPADPKWLQPRLARVLPAGFGLTEKTWRNTLSNTKSALAQAGIVERRANRIEDLSPDWRGLWEAGLAARDTSLQASLCRFVHFLSRHGVRPAEVREEHAEAFRDALVVNEIAKDPESTYRTAVNGWNRAVQRLDAWPDQRLALPSRTNHVRLHLETFPDGLRADMDLYFRGLRAPDPLSPGPVAKPLSEASVRLYSGKILKFASALVHAGVEPRDMGNLATLVDPVIAERGLRWLLARNGGASSQDIAKIAALLARIGREHVQVGPEAQARLDDMSRRLRVDTPSGMTAKNRERLRVFDDPNQLQRLLLLPDRLQERIDAGPLSKSAALASEDAVAIALLTHVPIRRKNVSRTHLERNLQRPGDGRAFLVFEGPDVKNGRRIEFELPRHLIDLIDRHVARRAPRLCPAGTPWLFPKRDGSAPMDANHFAKRIRTRIERELGVTMNVHLFRHLAAKVFLDANPGAYEAVRQLLGHAELSKTLAAYSGFEAGTATRLFAAALEQRTTR